MVKLTEEMVVARTRVSDFSAVKKLNCWGTELTDVSILRKMKNVEVLSLSINNINTLADFQYCHKLQDLFIRRNNIKDLNEICYLQGLPNLRNLWLGENPCAEREGYRLSVLRALPNLEKLDDKIVSPEEVQTAMTIGRPLTHPLEIDASPQSDVVSPEDITIEYIEENELGRSRRYSSSSDQRSFDETQHTHEEYDPDRRNANYNASSSHHYSQNNQYAYELQNGQSKSQSKDDTLCAESRSNNETVTTNTLEKSKVHLNTEDANQIPGWIRHSEKDKCRNQFHYHRRPVTRNSNILSAVLCLVKELDYPSLEVVEMAVRNRMDELEE
ncbi:PREDICTED: uncharacterized protein LOC108755208 [Trachymyrmex septentrionalis]|uniref:uncharacterized protein LOC108755208 n=1 Tax=Trachymyrmex septentrionalis TaxID=34720 RepID=UPI00084F78F1|nr:PREDICTED: uncharacterized protein LOC108755208 [Trachymyrmex septentrionalis]